MRKTYIFLSLIFTLFLSSCEEPTKTNTENKPNEVFQPKYAQFFNVEYYDTYKKISILNPWENEELNMNYYISSNPSNNLKYDAQNFIIHKTPEKIIALSSPMVGLLDILGQNSSIIGVSDPEYIYNEEIFQKVEEGKIANVGKSISINMETIISLQADLIIGSGWDKLSPDFERMIQLKQTPLLMYDWREIHPLGKAEWMILLSAFFDMEEEVIAKFKKIEKQYLSLKEGVHYDKQPTVLNGAEYQGIWYSAGGQSYMSQLYKDAGARYLLKDDSTSGSVMLDFEVIMEKAEKADLWIYTSNTSPEVLEIFKSPKYQVLNAVKNHNIYSYHKRINNRGANEYWETASYKPDVVLQDLIKIFHDSDPQNMYFFKKVEY